MAPPVRAATDGAPRSDPAHPRTTTAALCLFPYDPIYLYLARYGINKLQINRPEQIAHIVCKRLLGRIVPKHHTNVVAEEILAHWDPVKARVPHVAFKPVVTELPSTPARHVVWPPEPPDILGGEIGVRGIEVEGVLVFTRIRMERLDVFLPPTASCVVFAPPSILPNR